MKPQRASVRDVWARSRTQLARHLRKYVYVSKEDASGVAARMNIALKPDEAIAGLYVTKDATGSIEIVITTHGIRVVRQGVETELLLYEQIVRVLPPDLSRMDIDVEYADGSVRVVPIGSLGDKWVFAPFIQGVSQDAVLTTAIG